MIQLKPTRPSAQRAVKNNGRRTVARAASTGSTRRVSEGLKFARVFSQKSVSPFDEIEWDQRTAEITDDSGERINFSVRGVDYQIDLSAANVAKFEKALAPYLDAATRVGGRRTRTPKAAEPSSRSAKGGASRGRGKKAAGKGLTSKDELTAIREWAQQNGYDVASRGRIKADIVEAYHAAN